MGDRKLVKKSAVIIGRRYGPDGLSHCHRAAVVEAPPTDSGGRPLKAWPKSIGVPATGENTGDGGRVLGRTTAGTREQRFDVEFGVVRVRMDHFTPRLGIGFGPCSSQHRPPPWG